MPQRVTLKKLKLNSSIVIESGRPVPIQVRDDGASSMVMALDMVTGFLLYVEVRANMIS